MNNDILKEEIRLSHLAEVAYNTYMKEFIRMQKDYAISQFNDINADNINGLQVCKFLFEAINHLEEVILSDIETGKLAKIQLGENND